MTTKNILTILIVSLLAAIVLAKSKAVNEDHFKDADVCKLKNIYTTLASTEKDNTLKPTVQLMKLVMFDLQNLGLHYVRMAKNICDQMLKDPVITSSQSPEVVKMRENLQEYEKKYTECSEMEEMFDLVDLYSDATSHYYEMAQKGTLTADSKMVYDVLKKYSPKDLDDEFEHEFLNSFVTKFGRKINQIKEKLRKEEGGMGVKILQWWDKTKTLKTVEEKMEAFKEYMKLYGMDDE